MDKRCLIVSYYFPPTGGGGVQRVSKLIKYLSGKGWQFSVITAKEKGHLPDDPSLLNELPALLKKIEIPVKLPVAKQTKNKATYFWRWLSAFFYIPDIRKTWADTAGAQIQAEIARRTYRCVFITSPPYSLALLAAELTEKTDVPVILDLRDPWTTNPYKIHPTPYHLLKDRQLEKQAIKHVRYGISAYRSLLAYYARTVKNFPVQNWRFIPNGFDEEDFITLSAARYSSATFDLAFSGTFYSHVNNPRPLFKAIARLKKEEPRLAEKIRFHHVGKSMLPLKELAKQFGLNDQLVEWGYAAHKECLNILARMDAFCFILNDKRKYSDQTIGGKVYEYLRLRKPILALVPENGEAAEMIRQTDSGQVLASSNTKQITATLKEWLQQIPSYSFKGIEQYRRDLQAGKLADFLDQVCRNK